MLLRLPLRNTSVRGAIHAMRQKDFGIGAKRRRRNKLAVAACAVFVCCTPGKVVVVGLKEAKMKNENAFLLGDQTWSLR